MEVYEWFLNMEKKDMLKKYKLKKNTVIDLEKLQGYLKMTYEFSGEKWIKYGLLVDIIRYHVRGDDKDDIR